MNMYNKYRMLTKIVRNMKIEKAKDGSNLNDNESEALRFIIKHPGCIAGEVKEYLNVDKALITRIVRELAEAKLIEIQTGEDKRKKHLYPLPQALEEKSKLQSFEAEYYQRLFTGIPPQEQEAFFATLSKVYAESKRIRKGK